MFERFFIRGRFFIRRGGRAFFRRWSAKDRAIIEIDQIGECKPKRGCYFVVGTANRAFEKNLAVLFFDGENGRGGRGVERAVGGVAAAFGLNVGEL